MPKEVFTESRKVDGCKPLDGGCVRVLGAGQGGAVHVEPMKSVLKAPGTKRFNRKYDVLLSSLAFSFNLRRYNQDRHELDGEFVIETLQVRTH
jgi:hypothetical protein